MRGRIIQYNGADGSGTIVVDGKQYPFVLAAWRGNNAPALNKTVEITLDGDAITAVTAVGDDVLLKEKAAELGGKFNASIPALGGTTPIGDAVGSVAVNGPVSGGAIPVNSIIERYGKLMLGEYVLFLISTLMFSAVSMSLGGQHGQVAVRHRQLDGPVRQ